MKDLRVLVNAIQMRSIHMHHDFELLLVIDGQGYINIKNDKYLVSKGDALIINPYEGHEIFSNNDYLTTIIIQFSKHFIGDYFHELRNTIFLNSLIKNKYNSQEYKSLLDKIVSLSKHYLSGDNYFQLRCVSLLSEILLSLINNVENVQLSESEYSKRKKTNKRIERIGSYIDGHYQEPIRLSDIATIEGITPTHLSHFITDNFGMTFQEYLRDKRLENALRIINDEKLTLTEVAELSGFSDLKYLNAAFNEVFNVNPGDFRKRKLDSPLTINNKNASEHIYAESEAIQILNNIDIRSL